MKKIMSSNRKIIWIRLKLNLHEHLLRLLALFSLLIIIKTSEMPMLLSNGLIEQLFIQFKADNSMYQSIFSGIFVSYIFYLIVVKIPEDKRNRNIERVVSQKLSNILISLTGIFDDFVKQSSLTYKVSELNQEKIHECIGLIDQNSIVSGVVKNRNLDKFRYREYLVRRWSILQSQIDDILKYNALLDGECVKYLHDIKESKLSTIIPYLSDLSTDINNFSKCGNLFCELFDKAIDFNDYYFARYKNTVYKNPFD